MLKNKGLALGFVVSLVLHASVVWGLYRLGPKPEPITDINMARIDLGKFIVGGGESDAEPLPEPVEPVQEEEILEEIVEETEAVEPEVVETMPEITEITEDTIVEEVVEEIKPPVEEIVKKSEKPKEKVSKKRVEKKQTKKSTRQGGNNAINASSNTVASSPVTSDKPTQSMNASELSSIMGQIQSIIAREAKKNYPSSAKKRRQRGTVTVEFSYAPFGVVSGIRVVKSSGHKILDDTVVAVIERVKGKFPPIKEKTTITVPVKFSLN